MQKHILLSLTIFFVICFCLNGCVTNTSPFANRPVEELTEVYDPRTDGKYADFSGWGATYVIHKLRLDRCGMGRRLGGKFENQFFLIIKEIASDENQLNKIRSQISRGVNNVSRLSNDDNFVELLMEQSKQTCENPNYFTNQIINKMKTYGKDWRDNYSQK